MNSFPFSAPIQDQVAALEQNLELLRAFAQKYPDLEPWMVSALSLSVAFSSSQSAVCRNTFGRDGWQMEGPYAVKQVDGVRVELRIARPEPAKHELVTI